MINKIIISIIFGITCIFSVEATSQERSQIRSIYTYYNQLGVNNESIHDIENILLNNGIEQNNMEAVLRCIIGIIKDIPNESREFELSKKNKNNLQKIHVKPSQMEIIKRIALRINLIQNRYKKSE